MKEKSWFKYLLIIMLIISVVFCENYMLDKIKTMQWSISLVIEAFVFFVFYISIGLLIGLEHLIQEIRKTGSWRINIAKLVLLGIPSLYFSCGNSIYFGLGKFLPNVITYPIAMLIGNNNLLSIFQIVLGYSIISSFYKKVEDITK